MLKGDQHAALQEYLKGAPNSPAHWYQAALIAFREGDYVAACTYLRASTATPVSSVRLASFGYER